MSALCFGTHPQTLNPDPPTLLLLLQVETDRVSLDLAKKNTEGTSGNLSFSNRGMEVLGAGGATAPGGMELQQQQLDAAAASVGVPKQLADRVSRMLRDIEKELDTAEASIGSRMHVLDTDRDGIITQAELEAAFRLIKEQLSECSRGGGRGAGQSIMQPEMEAASHYGIRVAH